MSPASIWINIIAFAVVSVFHAVETPDLKSCGLHGFFLLCSTNDELELRSTGATKSYVVATMNYNRIDIVLLQYIPS